MISKIIYEGNNIINKMILYVYIIYIYTYTYILYIIYTYI